MTMPLDITLPDGSKHNPGQMNQAPAEKVQAMNGPAPYTSMLGTEPGDMIVGAGRLPRTIAVVANELEAAINAASKVELLREELDALLGKRKRGPKKGA
jgi:hypothetical protein